MTSGDKGEAPETINRTRPPSFSFILLNTNLSHMGDGFLPETIIYNITNKDKRIKINKNKKKQASGGRSKKKWQNQLWSHNQINKTMIQSLKCTNTTHITQNHRFIAITNINPTYKHIHTPTHLLGTGT